MPTLTPVQGNPFESQPAQNFRLTPVEGNPFETAASTAKPMVPLYIPDGAGGEIRIDDSNKAQFDAMQAQQDQAKAQEQAAFDATRTPLTRIGDTATFAASIPVRTLTKGQFGIGDVLGLANQTAGENARQAEADFARANETGLEIAKNAGDVLTGVPMLSTMGAVPGQMLNTSAAATRQLPREAMRMLRDTSGAAKIPGKAPVGPMTVAEFTEQYAKADPTVYQRIPYLSSKELKNELLFPEVRDGKVVGVTAIEQSPSQPGVYWSNFTSVDPAYRKQGIAKDLVQRKLDFVGNEGKQLKLSSMSDDGEAYLSKLYQGKSNVLREGDTDFGGKPLIREGKLVGTTGDAQVDQALIGSNGNVGQALQQTARLKAMAEQFGRPMPEADSLIAKLNSLGNKVQEAGGKVGDYGTPAPKAAAGGGATPPGGTVPPGAPPPSGPQRGGLPTRDEVIAAGERQNVTVPRMIAGSETQQDVAAALAGMPYAGAPVKMAYDKGLSQLGAARDVAMDTLGKPGVENAGTGAKQGILNWNRQTSDDYLEGLYKQVYAGVNPNVTRPLSATSGIAKQLVEEMKASTSRASQPAIDLVKDALSRPGGLTAQGLADLRSDIGKRISAAKTVPDAGEAAYKRLYPALTNDLRETVRAAGGDKSLAAWNRANREANIVAAKRRRLSQIIGSKDDTVSEEKVLERINALANAKGGNMRNLRLAKEVIGDKDWGNVGAELVSRLGINPKTAEFSAERFLTAYNKMGEQGKAEIFGPAKSALDDIATLSKRFHDLDRRFNKSNTGKVTTMLQILTNPTAIIGNLASMPINPAATGIFAGQMALRGGGLAGGRALAWHLASPVTAKKASNMVRAFYNVENAAARGLKTVAKNEEALASSIRAYSAELARQTGGNADEINAALSEKIRQARQGTEPSPSGGASQQ